MINPEEKSPAARLFELSIADRDEWKAKYEELLEVCKKVIKRDRFDQSGKPIHKELQAVIAKAIQPEPKTVTSLDQVSEGMVLSWMSGTQEKMSGPVMRRPHLGLCISTRSGLSEVRTLLHINGKLTVIEK